MQLQYLRKMAELSKKPKFKTEPIPTILTNRKISKTDEDDADLEYPSIFSNGNKVILLAFLVLGAAVALPKMISLPMAGNSGSAHHHQERPRLSPSANFNNLAMQERGRMGAHPASNSIFHEESVRSYKPAPGISRMPPIPMKLNMKMNAGGPATPVSQPKLGGTLSLITPVYAVGIIVFFVFTLWKIFFKDKEIEEDLEEEEDAKTYAADIKWDDVKSRISKISDIVEKVVDKQADNNPEKGMEDGPSDDEEDFSKQFENKQSDEMKYMDKERNIETFTPSGRISPGKLEKAKDAFDPRDLEISLLKARLEETEKAMERIVAHMGIVTSRLAPHVIAQALEGVNFDQDTASEKLKQGVNLEESESGNCIDEQIDCIPGSSENI
eukprot:TRINITY_DN18195_c0_g1_i2.p1 TRINITY_DN18195_c0_g1~~TRINITY_DN18195_c0_g1_i2.p1  ORF type:complete len:384 (-),score=105.67 TRINITY_DN18195_c0_g1_i2:154-1305(-)